MRTIRAWLLAGICTVMLCVSIVLAYELRFDFNIPPELKPNLFRVCCLVVGIKLVFLLVFRQFSGLLGYFSTPDLLGIFYASSLAAGVLGLIRWQTGTVDYVPLRGVILIDFILSFVGMASIRLGFRMLRERFYSPSGRMGRRARRVGIIGAGDVGANLAKELMMRRGLGLVPVAFFDDNKQKWNSLIHGIRVIGAPEYLLEQRLNLELEEAIIAMPTAPVKRIGEIVKVLQHARLKFATVPSVDQLATGQVKVTQLRSVDIQDLLGRDPVQLETTNIRQLLLEKVVMVTGAGGSIGSELCRQIASYNPKRLLMVDQSEVQLFPIEQEMIELGHGGVILPLVADILDEPRMTFLFDRFSPQVIFHAAAHKHVPMMESQPSEAIKNNAFGTAKVAELAVRFKAERFVLISTDKAINPTNVMGATKRLAETFIQALHAQNGAGTKLMAVRFGNVLGSSGSVIPTFHKQIAMGGPVKVTHPDVTRYFMTIPEAVGLVLQSGSQGTGGEIFVLDMGQPVKIIDLARQLIELSGFKPDEDIEIEIVGLRPGEKLYEEISHKGENIAPTTHPKIMRFVCEPKPLNAVRKEFDELAACLNTAESSQLKLLLRKCVPEYQPYLS